MNKRKRRIIRLSSFEKVTPSWFSSTLLSLLSWIISGFAFLFFLIIGSYTSRVPGIKGYVFSILLFLVIVFMGVAVFLLRDRAKSLRALKRDAETVRKGDARAPVLFLRSFYDDNISPDPSGFQGGFWRNFGIGSIMSLEEYLVKELEQYGPVITAGLPGETLPPPGAGRFLMQEDSWQDSIDSLIEEACLIVVLVGPTEGLNWEIANIVDKQMLSKTLFLLPPEGWDQLRTESKKDEERLRGARWVSLKQLIDETTLEEVGSGQRGRHPVLMLHFKKPGRGFAVISQGKQTRSEYQQAIRVFMPHILTNGPPPAAGHGISIVEIGMDS